MSTTQRDKINILLLETDYHLMSLHDAMEAGDTKIIAVEKRRLKEIRMQLVALGHYLPKS